MTLLFLDTATTNGVVGLFSDGLLIQKREFVAAFTNSKLLMPTIYEIVPDPEKLQCIAVGIGPGSYTGIRVAVAVAKGISFALQIPLVGVSSLKGFVPEKPHVGRFLAAIDAKIGGIYVAQAEAQETGIVFHGQEELLSVERFTALAEEVTCIVTSVGGAEVIRNRVPGITAHIIERVPS